MVRWTWWDWSLSLEQLLPSVLWHCWLGHLTRKKPVADMTYNVFSGTLNPTQSIIMHAKTKITENERLAHIIYLHSERWTKLLFIHHDFGTNLHRLSFVAVYSKCIRSIFDGNFVGADYKRWRCSCTRCTIEIGANALHRTAKTWQIGRRFTRSLVDHAWRHADVVAGSQRLNHERGIGYKSCSSCLQRFVMRLNYCIFNVFGPTQKHGRLT